MGLGQLHRAGPGALPDHEAPGGLGANWWTLFVWLAQPHKHFEAISSRPLWLPDVATHTHHAGQTRLTITACTPSPPSRADHLGGRPACTESHCGAMDRMPNACVRFSPVHSPHSCAQPRALLPCRPQKLRQPDTWTTVFRDIPSQSFEQILGLMQGQAVLIAHIGHVVDVVFPVSVNRCGSARAVSGILVRGFLW